MAEQLEYARPGDGGSKKRSLLLLALAPVGFYPMMLDYGAFDLNLLPCMVLLALAGLGFAATVTSLVCPPMWGKPFLFVGVSLAFLHVLVLGIDLYGGYYALQRLIRS